MNDNEENGVRAWEALEDQNRNLRPNEVVRTSPLLYAALVVMAIGFLSFGIVGFLWLRNSVLGVCVIVLAVTCIFVLVYSILQEKVLVEPMPPPIRLKELKDGWRDLLVKGMRLRREKEVKERLQQSRDGVIAEAKEALATARAELAAANPQGQAGAARRVAQMRAALQAAKDVPVPNQPQVVGEGENLGAPELTWYFSETDRVICPEIDLDMVCSMSSVDEIGIKVRELWKEHVDDQALTRLCWAIKLEYYRSKAEWLRYKSTLVYDCLPRVVTRWHLLKKWVWDNYSWMRRFLNLDLPGGDGPLHVALEQPLGALVWEMFVELHIRVGDSPAMNADYLARTVAQALAPYSYGTQLWYRWLARLYVSTHKGTAGGF